MNMRWITGERKSWMCLGVGLALAAAAVWGWQSRPWTTQLPPEVPPVAPHRVSAEPQALPPKPASRFLNASAEVKFIGHAACAKCHPNEHESYLRTAHSQALGDVNLAVEPPDVKFQHAPSGRTYEVLRRGNDLIHRESLPGPTGGEPIVAEHRMRYAVGSGHHSRTYLAEIDGFLIESPVTWYAAGKKWDMSPGYDRPEHSGFERIVDLGCVVCHAGRVEPLAESRYRMTIHEATIGCESCHGPGSLHSERQAGKLAVGGVEAEDLSIVHLARLTREENESICAQCHLRGGATPAVRGQRILDFRPGLRLADFHVDFVPEKPNSQMTVVGHVEQMRASACYRQSDSLTCTTCHDPHGSPAPEAKVEYFKARCVECHAAGCKLEPGERLKQNEQDNCVACHMPQRPTDLAHFAFTHHRIGLHNVADPGAADPGADDDSKQPVSLVPLADLAAFSPADQQRLQGLAYVEFAELHGRKEHQHIYHQRAKKLLTAARDAGADDALLEAGLAQMAWREGNFALAIRAARRALTHPDLQSGAHVNSRFVMADSFVQLRECAAAESVLEPLLAERRMATHWVLLGMCRGQDGDPDGAAQALLAAEQVSPFRDDIHRLLAEAYRRLGDDAAARHHGQMAEYLKREPSAGN